MGKPGNRLLEDLDKLQSLKREEQLREEATMQELRRIAEGNQTYSAYEQNRVKQKQMLQELLYEYTAAGKGDPELMEVLDMCQKYVRMNVTADSSTSEFEEEGELYNDILKKLYHYGNTLAERSGNLFDRFNSFPEDSGETPEKLAAAEELDLQEDRETIQMSLRSFFEMHRDGNLVPLKEGSQEAVDAHAAYVDYSEHNLGSRLRLGITTDHSEDPIFPHEPNPNDISQGYMGDCYLISALSAIAKDHPEKIREAIRDNHDGTATVRLFTRERGNTGRDSFVPVYVTVNKEISTGYIPGRSANRCLWAQLIEKAYAASGLHMSNSVDWQHAKPVPADLEARYKELMEKKAKNENPTREEYPWFIDKNGNISEFTPHYSQIEGGFNGRFVEHFLGSEGVCHNLFESRDFDDVKLEHHRGQKLSKNDQVIYPPGVIVKKMISIFSERGNGIPTWKELSEGDFDHFLGREYGDAWEDIAVKALSMVTVPRGEVVLPFEIALALKNIANAMGEIFREFGSGGKELEALGAKEPGEKLIRMLKEIKDSLKVQVDAFAANNKDDALTYELAWQYLEEDIFSSIEQDIQISGIRKFENTYNGRYTQYEERAFNAIGSALNAGKPVSCGAPEGNGIVDGPHAYSVLGVRKDDKEPHLMYVKIRNPWGTTSYYEQGIEYYQDKEGKMAFRDVKCEHGIFEVELRDFVKAMDELNINEPMAQKKAEPEKAQEEVFADKVDNVIAGRYFAALNDLEKSLKGTDYLFSSVKDSDAFNNMKKAVSVAKIQMLGMAGKSFEELGAVLKNLQEKSDIYIEHAQKAGLNDRRMERSDFAKSARYLQHLAATGEPNPQKSMQKKVADSIITALEKQSQKEGKTIRGADNPEIRSKMIKDIMQSEKFTGFVESKSYSEMFRESSSADGALLGEFMQVITKAANPPAARPVAPEVQQPAAIL